MPEALPCFSPHSCELINLPSGSMPLDCKLCRQWRGLSCPSSPAPTTVPDTKTAQRRKVSLQGSAPRATRRGRRARDGDTLGIGLCFFRAVFVQVGPPDRGHLHAELWKCWFPGRPLAPPPPPGSPTHTNAGRPHTPPVSLSPHSPFPASPGLYVLPPLAFPTSSSSFRLPEASPLAPSFPFLSEEERTPSP